MVKGIFTLLLLFHWFLSFLRALPHYAAHKRLNRLPHLPQFRSRGISSFSSKSYNPRRSLGLHSGETDALCGSSSHSGNMRCPLNVCCSAAGYCGTGVDFCSLSNSTMSCQKEYGSCENITRPSSTCGPKSSTGRSVGYLQLDNIEVQRCNGIYPDSMLTQGLTHLFLAFASIDPDNFSIVPHREDLYKKFTTLESSTNLQTWIAIGGWAFSDPGPTETTWSRLASCPLNRRKFIVSLKNFFPGTSARNGRPEDTKNFVALLKELRAEFRDEFGISVALPASYWYLRWFDVKSMEEFVDFFGLMAYDLHGVWDGNGEFGKFVAGHTSIAEIQNMILPLWYADIEPAKINLGLAYYGRGYTLSSPTCNIINCSWVGPSRGGNCTKTPGVMTLKEIKDLIFEKGIEPLLLSREMMKQVSWDNQWIGYDDMETIEMKKQWANKYCFGGTTIWSIDQYFGTWEKYSESEGYKDMQYSTRYSYTGSMPSPLQTVSSDASTAIPTTVSTILLSQGCAVHMANSAINSGTHVTSETASRATPTAAQTPSLSRRHAGYTGHTRHRTILGTDSEEAQTGTLEASTTTINYVLEMHRVNV
ncbi:hypothetical protein FQN57_002465 [Myotisia sp. PD_48]|nr:hypothetical protein FQN57_002465 [Myotisia sp. PD_48]